MFLKSNKRIKKSIDIACQEKYIKFMDRSEIDRDFSYQENGYDLTSLKVSPKVGDIIIRYQKADNEIGYEGYISDVDTKIYAFILRRYADDGQILLDGMMLDSNGCKLIDNKQNFDLASMYFDFLENKFNDNILSREDKGNNLDFVK